MIIDINGKEFEFRPFTPAEMIDIQNKAWDLIRKDIEESFLPSMKDDEKSGIIAGNCIRFRNTYESIQLCLPKISFQNFLLEKLGIVLTQSEMLNKNLLTGFYWSLYLIDLTINNANNDNEFKKKGIE